LFDSYASVDPVAWDNLVTHTGSPFLEHLFLSGLEETGCATEATGWTPLPICVYEDGRLVAAAPGWVKTHSMGEFVYDHAWADAAQQAGMPYYPKLVIGVPFTPVTGRRLLIAEGPKQSEWLSALASGIARAARGLQGVHLLFCTENEAEALKGLGLFPRLQFQFHWYNNDYKDFEGYLASLKGRRRTEVRRERRALSDLDIRASTVPTAAEMDALHAFYTNTCAQFGHWGRTYLNRDFFALLAEHWGERLHTVIARDGDTLVAGALNVQKGTRLYGRYWGCSVQRRFLHFEVCYYQAIEYAVAHGLTVFEPGHGGGHKYRRGFRPTLTWSSHALTERRLHQALENHTKGERSHVRRQAAGLAARQA
jgi:uncharacterized protein